MKLESPFDQLLRKYRMNLVLPYVTSDMNICDLGCGVNPTLLKHLSNVTVGKLVGVDRLVLNSPSAKVELRASDFDQIPLPIDNAEFDLITMLAVLEHLDNYDAVINECFRGLKIGGKLILTTPSPRSKPILEFLANLGIVSYIGIYDHKKYFKEFEIFTLLQKYHFTDIRVWSVACGLNTVALATRGG
jgi:2-polyprenyl-3-methyl-5-hydroxy-6-metoxy-1,4-benzoquinol methylase